MNPANPGSFNHRTAKLSTGRTYHFIDQSPADVSRNAPTILCLHGFPDLWYGWRFQIAPWNRAGYRVVVPDLLGYGGTDMPGEVEAYSSKNICRDLAALLDFLGISKAIVAGHDWGAFTAARFALWHPDRLSALVIVSVPFTPPAPHYRAPEEAAKIYPDFGYQVYFADPRSSSEIESDLSFFFRLLFRNGNPVGWSKLGELKGLMSNIQKVDLPTQGLILTEEEHKYYISQFQRGINGPLSYYRTGRHRFEEEKAGRLPSSLPKELPVLFIYGTVDQTCPPPAVKSMHKFIPNLDDVALPNVGHWALLEEPKKVAEIVEQWLKKNGQAPEARSRL
ncbi:alpha beta-hydrolase [Coniophora puteana RWD-64-598 SS2]|uniref:Alpha beta-hydrolase n=1 Tax=Coniophora puteana (strain RWD-64-598) TaxID=741705 RepID=A0A5M3MC05_CONPW|nr:alpha beta-hydrolase [Coniophora puteana RWD-64-598 SS2]EIW76350.1 alpha beta-hydrolase [Coniophora puteana RWD-64-598 SS2]